jgi:hypothetical protein
MAFVVATPVIAVTPESVIPVPAVMPAVLGIATPLDLFQTVTAYRRRKIHTHDTAPGTFVVLRPVPGTLTENEEVIPVVNDVIWSSIGNREAIIIQINEIGPGCQMDFRITRNTDAQNLDAGKCFRLRLARQQACNPNCQQNLFFHEYCFNI